MQSRAAPPADVFNLGVLGVAQALGLSAMSMMVFIGGIVGRELAPRPALATLPLAACHHRSGRDHHPGGAAGAPARPAARVRYRGAAGNRGGTGACARGQPRQLRPVLRSGRGARYETAHLCSSTASPPPRAQRPNMPGAPLPTCWSAAWWAVCSGPRLPSGAAICWRPNMPAAFWCLPLCWRCWRWWSAACGTTALASPRPRHRPIARRSQARRPRRGPRAASLLSAPGFGVAVLAAAVAYAVMSSIMTATPLHLSAAGLPLDRTAIIIQSHVIAMYLPSLASGYIMDRLGVARVLLVGVAGMTASIVVGVYAASLLAFWAALVLARPRVEHAVSRRHRAVGAEGRRGRTLSPAGHQRLRCVRRAGAGLPIGRNRAGPGGGGTPLNLAAPAAAGLGSDHRPGTALRPLRHRPAARPRLAEVSRGGGSAHAPHLQDAAVVVRNLGVVGHQHEIVDLALRNQHAVERISVEQRQFGQLVRLARA